MNYKISQEEFFKTWNIYGLPLKLRQETEDCLHNLESLEKIFWEGLMGDQGELSMEIKNLSTDLEIYKKSSTVEETKEMSKKFSDLGDMIEKAIQQANIINNREKILNLKLSDYSELDKINKEFQPYNRVW
jgi:dynein heavy chain